MHKYGIHNKDNECDLLKKCSLNKYISIIILDIFKEINKRI